MSELYHASMYADDVPVPSYWEDSVVAFESDDAALAEDVHCDVAIIGGGFTGLSAALHLARDYGVDVRVLEAGHIGWGASGRNGGFCCLAATKLSLEAMIKRYGVEETQRFYACQLDGVDLLDTLAREESFDFDKSGQGNYEVAHHRSRYDDFKPYAETFTRLFGIKTEVLSKDRFAEIGHDSTEQFGAMYTDAGFALNPLKLTQGLARAASRHGARLHPHSRVLEWTKQGEQHVLMTRAATVRANRVIVATNGFTRDDLHPGFDGVTLPAISNIVTTRVLDDSELAAYRWKTHSPLCNTRTLLFYYRLLPDRRILFGARGDTTGEPAAGERMRKWMIGRFRDLFPAWGKIEFSHFWRGFVCVTRRFTPCVGRLPNDPSVWFGFGYHANGVNTAPWVGMVLARNIAGSNSDQVDVPVVMSGLSPRFPLPRLRLWGLRAAYLYYRYKDLP